MATSPEISSPTPVSTPDGRLRRDAVGWARHPLHEIPTTLASLPRFTAWNYWAFTFPEGTVMALFADVGVAGVALLSFLDHASGKRVEAVRLRPGGLRVPLGPHPRDDASFDAPGLHLHTRARGDEMWVSGESLSLVGGRLSVDLVVGRPRDHETLDVLVPFGDDAFQLTSKQQALPVRGVVRAFGRTYVVSDDAWACLDFGRGRRPRGIHWCWAFASGRAGDATLGLNLGAHWTRGTGVTENGFVLGGRLHKIHEDVAFDVDLARPREPWRLRSEEGDRVDLAFTPEHVRVVRAPLGLVHVALHQTLGRFRGTLRGDAGERVPVDGLFGLAESMRAAW